MGSSTIQSFVTAKGLIEPKHITETGLGQDNFYFNRLWVFKIQAFQKAKPRDKGRVPHASLKRIQACSS